MSASDVSGKGPGLKVAVMASAGAAVEWYDFFIYGTAAALVFPRLFFPADLPPFVAQIASFSTFAVGFIARPVGGMLFGHFGDIHGRKRALVAAMFLMGLSTTLIGLLPSYASIGVWAPLLLVALRFVQGLGGRRTVGRRGAAGDRERAGPSPRLLRQLRPGRRAAGRGAGQFGVPGGQRPDTDEAFMAWGWRIGFVLSVAADRHRPCVHSAFPNRRPSIATNREPPKPSRRRSPLAEAAREPLARNPAGRRRVRRQQHLLLRRHHLCGRLRRDDGGRRSRPAAVRGHGRQPGDDSRAARLRRGVRPVRPARPLPDRGAAVGVVGVRGVPADRAASPLAIVLAITVQLLFVSMMYGPQAALFAELFPKSVRYSGASLGYQIGAVVGGGFAPIIATALFARYQSSAPIAIYLAAMCAISFVSVILLGRRMRARLAD
jgi:MFS family permease